MVISITVSPQNLQNVIGKYSIPLQQASRRGIQRVAMNAQKELRAEIKRENLIDNGNLLNKTRARKISPNRWAVFMPKYGTQLDSMRPHAVWLRPGRRITDWAKRHGIRGFIMKKLSEAKGSPQRGISVKKHPFIQPALMRTERKARRIVENEINKAIRRRGR